MLTNCLVFFFIGTGDINARPGMVQHVLPDVNVPSEVEPSVTRSRFVKDPDHALERIQNILEQCHRSFFANNDSDLKVILDKHKTALFQGCSLVFSGLTPTNVKIEDSHFWKLSQQYGAVCELDVTHKTTHVITYRCDTSKVLCATERGIKVVTPEWILQSVYKWERLPEDPYISLYLPPTSAPAILLDFNVLTNEIDMELESDSEDEESFEGERHHPKKRLRASSCEEETDSLEFDSENFVDELEKEIF